MKWSVNYVMRDFVQNFFDEIGPERFQEDFRHEYDGKTLTVYNKGGVELDWFCYAGVGVLACKMRGEVRR